MNYLSLPACNFKVKTITTLGQWLLLLVLVEFGKATTSRLFVNIRSGAHTCCSLLLTNHLTLYVWLLLPLSNDTSVSTIEISNLG